MDLQTYDLATELLKKYRLCETMLEYMSDTDAVTGQKYKEQCGEFFKVFHDEMLVFTHELMTKCGEEFTQLHCCEHSEHPDTPVPPTEEKVPKFPIGSEVEIVDGDFIGYFGTVMDYESDMGQMAYYVSSDFNDNGNLFSMWFPESELKACVDESEDSNYFVTGDRVKVVLSTAKDYGRIGTVEDVEHEFIVVVLDGEDYNDRLWFYPEDLELYADPENPEENGAGDTDPTEGE